MSLTDKQIPSAILRGVDITEVYSPQRVVELCSKHGLYKGDSFDLRTGFDLSDHRVQEQVSQRIAHTRPKLVIFSPLRTKLSTLQECNIAVHGPEWEKEFAIEKEKAIKHIDYCMRLARTQIKRGDD